MTMGLLTDRIAFKSHLTDRNTRSLEQKERSYWERKSRTERIVNFLHTFTFNELNKFINMSTFSSQICIIVMQIQMHSLRKNHIFVHREIFKANTVDLC